MAPVDLTRRTGGVSRAHRAKISAARKGKPSNVAGRSHSEGTKARMSAAMVGPGLSDAHKREIVATMHPSRKRSEDNVPTMGAVPAFQGVGACRASALRRECRPRPHPRGRVMTVSDRLARLIVEGSLPCPAPRASRAVRAFGVEWADLCCPDWACATFVECGR